MATRPDRYPPAYDKQASNKIIQNVPDSWITRWPDRYTRELGSTTTTQKARTAADKNKEQ